MIAPQVLDGWSSNWWALGLRALAAMLLGIIAIGLPGPTLAAIVIVFGIYAITDGILAIIAAIRGVRRKERWGAMLLEGIVGIVAGAIALFSPAIGALALTYLVAAWALATGALEIAAAIRLRKIMTGEWLLLVAGLLSIVLAVLVAAFPGTGALMLVWWLGAYALAYGVVSLVLAFRVRSWAHANV
ncbi:MAG TPA: HdeD family acid-resistance protein [Gemmatimonadaceae bacterium]|nr:HdeD family acid-resistance protein [Gemmatimonadaceae bacterium]